MKHDNLIHAVTLLVFVTLCLGCSSSQNNWPSVKVSDLPVEEMMTEWRTDVEAALSEAGPSGSTYTYLLGSNLVPAVQPSQGSNYPASRIRESIPRNG